MNCCCRVLNLLCAFCYLLRVLNRMLLFFMCIVIKRKEVAAQYKETVEKFAKFIWKVYFNYSIEIEIVRIVFCFWFCIRIEAYNQRKLNKIGAYVELNIVLTTEKIRVKRAHQWDFILCKCKQIWCKFLGHKQHFTASQTLWPSFYHSKSKQISTIALDIETSFSLVFVTNQHNKTI